MPSPPPPLEREHWTLDKRLNVGHLLTTVALAASIFAWGAAIERRTAVLEEKARAQVDRDSAQDMAGANAVLLLRNEFSELRNEIRETNRKLDRYLERLGGRP